MSSQLPPSPTSTVSLPRWAFGLLIAACAVGVLTVTFLLGRVTAPAPQVAPARVEAASQSTAAAAPAESYRAPTGELSVEALATPQGLASDPSPGAEHSSAEQSSGGVPDAGAVAAYFTQMDAIASEAKAGQDPQALARKIVEQTISGNTGAIEGLIATQRALELRLGRIQPPPACREHHQRSLRLFARAIALLEQTRNALSGQNASDLGNIAAEGRAIEQEAKALDALANDIRRAAGLAPVPEPAS